MAEARRKEESAYASYRVSQAEERLQDQQEWHGRLSESGPSHKAEDSVSEQQGLAEKLVVDEFHQQCEREAFSPKS